MWQLGKALAVCAWLLCLCAYAQAQQHYQWVFFADKGPEAQHYLRQPQRMLGQAALVRRAKYQLAVDESDVPVSHSYLQLLRLRGWQVVGSSRWLNAALVRGGMATWPACVVASCPLLPVVAQRNQVVSTGVAAPIHDMLGLATLHARGMQGQGVRIAVFDSGFLQADQNPFFAQLFTQGRIIATRDFVSGGSNVYDDNLHGAQVFSVLAASSIGQYVGTAPAASYLLARTENVFSETHQEELNWANALEWADSAGADIVNSSLSYNLFDAGQGDYAYADMDGATTLITRAAERALAKGMLVVTSAGNEGLTPWKKICAPCDGDSVLCVGAVNSQGAVAGFSSLGPSADGRIKPDVCTLGQGVAVVNANGNIGVQNGTSFSAPAVAGMAACLLQAHPLATPMQLIQAIRQSSSRYTNPDTLVGYGIPRAARADSILVQNVALRETPIEQWWAYPNPVRGGFTYIYRAASFRPLTARLLNSNGQLVRDLGQLSTNVLYHFSTTGLAAGVYFLHTPGDKQPFRLLVE